MSSGFSSSCNEIAGNCKICSTASYKLVKDSPRNSAVTGAHTSLKSQTLNNRISDNEYGTSKTNHAVPEKSGLENITTRAASNRYVWVHEGEHKILEGDMMDWVDS